MFGRLGATEIWILVGLVLLFLLGMWIGSFRRPHRRSVFDQASVPPDIEPAEVDQVWAKAVQKPRPEPDKSAQPEPAEDAANEPKAPASPKTQRERTEAPEP